ncbi:MAG: hypothetical protein D6795_07035 [Deltaproteobacteria bacterium]|nr:MAG: hypothetical protein D6795_07035 [Deltaproteobacteria bacterium]
MNRRESLRSISARTPPSTPSSRCPPERIDSAPRPVSFKRGPGLRESRSEKMKRKRTIVSIGCLLLSGFLLGGPGGCPSTSPQPHLELVGLLKTSPETGGGPGLQDIFPSGSLLYAVFTTAEEDQPGTLRIFDVEDPENPRMIGTVADTAGEAPHDIRMQGGNLYVTSWSHIGGMSYAYFESFDLGDPSHPAPLDAFMIERSELLALAVEGNAAYVGQEYIPRQVSVFDISNPADLRLAASVEVRQEVPVFNIRISGDTAFLANSGIGVSTLDISSPFDPRFLSTFEIPYGSVVDLEVVGRYAFVPWNTGPEKEISELLVLDVNDPTAMTEIRKLELGLGSILSVTHHENLLFIANQRVHEDEILLIDISDPMNPKWIGKSKVPEELDDVQRHLYIRDDLLYVGCVGGIAIYRIVVE